MRSEIVNAALLKEADKIWKRMSTGAPIPEMKPDMEVYQKLLSFFMPGDYYYYIFNIPELQFDFISEEMSAILGYDPIDLTVPFFISRIHPDDQPWFLNFESKTSEFFLKLTHDQVPNYKVRYDYRGRKNDGEYIRILQQVITLQYNKNVLLRTLGVHTDITHLKLHGTPTLSFIGLNGEPSYLNVSVKQKFKTGTAPLTKREIEILRLLAEGKKSKEIGMLCHISTQTVNTHRRNMLTKTECGTAAALIALSVKKDGCKVY